MTCECDQLVGQLLALLQRVGHLDGVDGVVQRESERCRIAAGSGNLDGLGGQRAAARRVAGVVQLIGQQREHPRAPRMVAPECFCRGLERPHAIGVDAADFARVSATVGEHRAAKPVCVAELLGELGGVEQRLAVVRVADPALCLAQADQQVAALGAIAARRLLEELERLAIPACGLTGRELLERALCRSPRVVVALAVSALTTASPQW